MKHVIIPIIVLVLILGIGAFESICLYDTFKKFENRVDQLILSANQQTLTTEQFDEFEDYWHKIRKKSEFFLPHSDVYEITLRVGEIRAYVEQQDFELCQANLFVIKELASYVSHLAIPSLGHVF